MAFAENMAVSFVSLGKETPIDKPHQLYPKIIANTYLPGAAQPGFRRKLEDLTKGSNVSGELLAYTAKELETDKLYFLLRAFLVGVAVDSPAAEAVGADLVDASWF